MSRLTDMTDFKIIPQVIEGAEDIVRKAKDEYVCNMLFDLKIDKDVLENQLKEIHRLNDVIREYEELEEQGLLLKLPCKVGQKVWIVFKDNIIEEHIVSWIKIGEVNDTICFEDDCCYSVWNKNYEDFKKWVFFTREEAEQELKRLECAE